MGATTKTGNSTTEASIGDITISRTEDNTITGINVPTTVGRRT